MNVPGLLVSVRSVDEARAAAEGGASIIDVKDPARGPLGRADAAVWAAVRAVVPAEIPVSVALGELPEWSDLDDLDSRAFAGIAYRKLGLAGASPSWRDCWKALRQRWGGGSAWVAVAYSDWRRAGSPAPEQVLEVALAAEECAAILVDTWDKSRRTDLDAAWLPWILNAREGGLRVAIAGGLVESEIERLAFLEPDWFAVRGAACRDGHRGAAVDRGRVARLAELVARSGAG